MFLYLFLTMLSLLGPKPKTIEDFWTMITQEDVPTIVCLTNLKEGAKVLGFFLKINERNYVQIIISRLPSIYNVL